MNITRFFTVLSFTFLTCVLAESAQAQGSVQGTPFFLLSDTSYSSKDSAMVRLEAQNMGNIAEYGGVDVYVYRVKQPVNFLKAQKNLHRIDVEGRYVGTGMSNVMTRVWDNWWLDSRKTWRNLFSDSAKLSVRAQAPEVRSHPLFKVAPPDAMQSLYRPLKEHTLVDNFRYPVHLAKPIQAPKGVALEGSSSEFIAASQGNVLIPLGKRAPGLYLVEAVAGDHRAVTLVFVSDSIAVTKVSGKQMMVWVADRLTGKPVAGVKTVWSDGVGVLANGTSDKRGIVNFQRNAPEKTLIYGEDPKGGVYVSENFYYDSEIYNTKIYAVTDRPLYRPGETVFVKFFGRTFTSARDSVALTAGEIKLQVFDPSGFPVAGKDFQITPQNGADTSFQLPNNAVAGGYELRFNYKGNSYGAAFRVAEYQKPHFEINILPEKRDYKTNEELKGKLQLVYPDGKPVVNARAELSVRAQRLSMIEGDLGYAGQFPVQLSTTSFATDSKGMAQFSLPAATEPSRYILTVLATDGAAYRVRVSKELLIERGAGTYMVKADHAFSAVNESVTFSTQLQSKQANLSNTVAIPVSWDWVRLENRARSNGSIVSPDRFALQFAEPGTYTISLRDAAGNIVGATSHYVSGAGVKAPQGSIEMVFDKTSYKAGDVAKALITFPQKIEQALFTLERDKVEKTALLSEGGDWINAKRLSDQQWQAEIPIQDNYGPNITLSVVYVKGNDYVFQNLGLKVEQAKVEVAVQADKATYLPGEKVTLSVSATIGGKAAAGSQLTVGVVDEMIYVLQPEIAPDIFDFFYHPRRNNVRTSASLNFIAYDLAKPPSQSAIPTRSQTHERAIKLLERPRREDKDTAFWNPSLNVDSNGRAQVSFIMPDSLTRWRITIRANNNGTVGQTVSHIRSEKDFYVKWTSPNWMRQQDTPNASVAIFNQGNKDASVDFSANGNGISHQENVKLKPGANFVTLPLKAQNSTNKIDLSLSYNGKTVDALSVPLKVIPQQWQSERSISVPLTGKDTALKLPADASNIRLQFTDGASAQFRRLMDDLIEYPYGCVEQTSSRIIPYSLALSATLPSEERLVSQLSQSLYTARFRLAQMAGPQATFGWWSTPEKDGDVFLTTYAYYADWHASQALKLTLPDGHFNRLLEIYRLGASHYPVWQRSLILYWMNEMGLPVKSMAEAVLEESAKLSVKSLKDNPASRPANNAMNTQVLTENQTDNQTLMALLLSSYVTQQSGGKIATTIQPQIDQASQRLKSAVNPLTQSLLLLTGKRALADANTILEQVRSEYPTIDRSLILLWTYRAISGGLAKTVKPESLLRGSSSFPVPEPTWQATQTATGSTLYRWNNTSVPSAVKLNTPAAAGSFAVAHFESREAETTSLPVHITRHIYRLVNNNAVTATTKASKKKKKAVKTETLNATPSDVDSYQLELLSPETPLKTDEVYLDELIVARTGNSPLRYGIVEVALPPGSNADRATWGFNIRFPGRTAAEALEKARYEQTPRGYAVPIDALNGRVVIRHLIRAAQTGKFFLPSARYYNMYQADQKAFEEKARAFIEVR